jgi:hypothetical protein
MRNILWNMGRPIDWLARIGIVYGRAWQAYRLSIKLGRDDADPLIKEMSMTMDDEGKFEAKVMIEKYPATMDLGLEMMQLMNDYPDAGNYISLSSLAPDGKLYTLSVEHSKSKPKHMIIAQLKRRLAEYEKAQENPTQED